MNVADSRAAPAMIAVLMSMAASAAADPIADYYKGRTISLIVGSGPGGGYDLSARLVARHLPRFVPGNPTRKPVFD